MTREQLYQYTMGHSGHMISLIEREYGDYIRVELERLLGRASDELVSAVTEQIQARLSDVAADCDMSSLVFDCIHSTVFQWLNECPAELLFVSNSILREYYEPDSGMVSDMDSLRLDIALDIMTGAQREYFFNRYYYFKEDVPVNKKYERAISRLFSGKDSIAAVRFRYFHVPTVSVTPWLYIKILSTLNSHYISQMGNFRSALFVKAHPVSLWMGYKEFEMRKGKLFLRFLPYLIILMFIFLAWMYFSLDRT